MISHKLWLFLWFLVVSRIRSKLTNLVYKTFKHPESLVIGISLFSSSWHPTVSVIGSARLFHYSCFCVCSYLSGIPTIHSSRLNLMLSLTSFLGRVSCFIFCACTALWPYFSNSTFISKQYRVLTLLGTMLRIFSYNPLVS